MAFVDGFISFIDEFTRGIRDWSGLSTSSYCDLESAASHADHVLVAKDASCVSLIHWEGSRVMVGVDEFESNVRFLSQALSSAMIKRGHRVQVVFGCEKSQSHAERSLDDLFAPIYAAARKQRLDLEDLLDDRRAALAKHCAPEYCYVALWTYPTSINSNEWAKESKKHREKMKGTLRGRFGQTLNRAPQVLIDQHRSFVEFFHRDLTAQKIDAKILGAGEACRAIRQLVDDEWTDGEWTPHLPGDTVTLRGIDFNERDTSGIMLPGLPDQLIPRPPEFLDLRAVAIGDRIWAPVAVTVPQKNSTPMQDLFIRMRTSGIPWRICFTLASDGLGGHGFNSSLAGALTLGSSSNAEMSHQYKELQRRKIAGEANVGLSIMAATWVPRSAPNPRERLAENASRLATGLQSWGGCEVSEVTGHPAYGFFSTVPGISMRSVAPECVCPLEDALELMPWGRAASPWKSGHVLFRTPDGKPFPYSSYSSKQDAWITIIISPMGGGKSVLMNGLNLGLILDPQNEGLPLIRILDVGPSSSGLTSLVSNALPDGKAYESQYHRILNTHEYAWNPCDTPLGQRFPLTAHKDFLTSFLVLLATPLADDSPPDGVNGIAQIAVDLAYHRYADTSTSTPRRYSPMASKPVDEALARHNIAVDEETTYWEIEDRLFQLNDLRGASAAHRMAMPLITEIAQCAKDDSIAKLYPDSTVGGLPLPDFFRRKLMEAVNQYAILQRHTRFDIGDSSIVSLDLDEVAKRGSASALRKTTVMYLLSLWQLTADFFIGESVLPYINPMYHDYHAQRVKELSRKKKRLCADELHRPVESSPTAIGMIDQIMREGRKWGIDLVLASQRFEDFPSTMVDLASCIYVMKPPGGGARKMVEPFQLSPTEEWNISNKLHGPQKGHGANFYARFLTKEGSFSHLLTNTSGAIELWAFTTTQEDRQIRDALYRKMPGPDARRMLSRRFGGSAQDEVLRMAEMRSKTGTEDGMTVMDALIDSVYKEYLGSTANK